MYKWYAWLLDGQERIYDEKCSGRRKIVMSNHVAVIKEQGAISEINGDSYCNSFQSTVVKSAFPFTESIMRKTKCVFWVSLSQTLLRRWVGLKVIIRENYVIS